MWTIYDIHTDRYWNEERRAWCAREEATHYSVEERDQLPLQSLSAQWRYIARWYGRKAPNNTCVAWG